MKKYTGKIIVVCFLLIGSQNVKSQEDIQKESLDILVQKHLDETPFYKNDQLTINEENILKRIDAFPAFGVYKDTYFTTGIPLDRSINRNTADAMFQISIRHRLTKSRLPFNTFLYFTYTQKSFWNLYAESAPFKDNNYNPGIGLGKYIIHDNKYKGTAFLQLEHESNGKDGEGSRSWNMISFSSKYFYNLQLSFGLKVWIPIVDGEENKDLVDYRGIGALSVNYITKNGRWWLSGELNPRRGFGNVNTTLTAGFKVTPKDNQYVYARFYNGKGDSLLDYDKYHMNIRIGFCIKPDFGSAF